MKLAVVLAGALTLGGADAGMTGAQQRATFAGTWVGDPTPRRLTITQDAERLTVTDERRRTFTYRMDGSESRNEAPTVRGEKWIYVSQARWVSSALVVTTTITRETGATWDMMTIYRRDVEGNLQVSTLDALLNSGPQLAMGLSTVAYKRE